MRVLVAHSGTLDCEHQPPVTAEHRPELTETDPERLAELWEEITPNMQAVLRVLIEHAPERLSFAELEAILHWPRGRFASVFGGFRAARGKLCLRPFHLCEPRDSPTREWELWLDAEQAAVLRTLAV
jgi:hypothetical protein